MLTATSTRIAKGAETTCQIAVRGEGHRAVRCISGCVARHAIELVPGHDVPVRGHPLGQEVYQVNSTAFYSE